MNLTNGMGFPHESFIDSTKACFTDALVRNTTWFPCIRSLINKYGRMVSESAVLTAGSIWKPQVIGKNPEFAWRIQDCSYKIDKSSATVNVHANGVPFFTFAINQTGCLQSISVHGGAALEVIGRWSHGVVGCSVVDLFSSQYQIFCPTPDTAGSWSPQNTRNGNGLGTHGTHETHSDGGNTVTPPLASSSSSSSSSASATSFCMHLTILLDYEHFGAFDDWLRPGLKTPGLRHVLYDHFELCTATATSTVKGIGESVGAVRTDVAKEVTAVAGQGGHRVGHLDRRRIVTFSGHWRQTPVSVSLPPSVQQASSQIAFVLFSVQEERTNSSHVDTPLILQHALNEVPQPAITFELDSWLWEPTTQRFISYPEALAAAAVGGNIATITTPAIFDPAIYEGSTDPRGDNHKAYTRGSLMTFMGCSHVRYLYDALVLEAGSYLPRNRKHGSCSTGNYRYIEEYLAQHQATRVEQYCRELEAESREQGPGHGKGQKWGQGYEKGWRDHVLFLQPGAWDTTHQSPRMIIYNNESAPALMLVLERILSGSLKCGRLRQIVWFTAMPYPLCVDDPVVCNKVRLHRSNGAIQALNSYFLKRLHGMNTSLWTGTGTTAPVMLSIVDAFSIIYPRLLQKESEEVVCVLHYLCRMNNDKLFFTPGAAAYIRATKAALKWGYALRGDKGRG